MADEKKKVKHQNYSRHPKQQTIVNSLAAGTSSCIHPAEKHPSMHPGLSDAKVDQQ